MNVSDALHHRHASGEKPGNIISAGKAGLRPGMSPLVVVVSFQLIKRAFRLYAEEQMITDKDDLTPFYQLDELGSSFFLYHKALQASAHLRRHTSRRQLWTSFSGFHT